MIIRMIIDYLESGNNSQHVEKLEYGSRLKVRSTRVEAAGHIYFPDCVFIWKISEDLQWHYRPAPSEFLLGQRYSLPEGAQLRARHDYEMLYLLPGDLPHSPELDQCRQHKSKVLSFFMQANKFLALKLGLNCNSRDSGQGDSWDE